MQRISNPIQQAIQYTASMRTSSFAMRSLHKSINQSSIRTFVQLSTANVIKSTQQSNVIHVLTTPSGAVQLSNRFMAWARGRPEASMLCELRKGNFRTDPIMIRLIERFGDNFGLENAASSEDLYVARYAYDQRVPRELIENELNETGTFNRDAVMIKLAKNDSFKSVEEMNALYELLGSVKLIQPAA